MEPSITSGKTIQAKTQKNILKTISYLVLISLILSACQSRHYGHLSKVRVKQKLVIKHVEKPKKEKVALPEASNPEEQVTASLEPQKELISIPEIPQTTLQGKEKESNQTLQKKTSPRPKKAEKNKPLKNKTEAEPTKHNYPAFIAAGLSVLSLLAIAADFFLIELGTPSIVAFVTAIPILILGFTGLNKYQKKRAKNGKGLAIFSIVVGFTLIAVFLALLVFIILFIFSGGYGATD